MTQDRDKRLDVQGFLFETPPPTPTQSLRTRPAAYHASSPRERAVRYLFFQTLLGYEHHPRAVNLLIYSRRFLEFCQPRPQSALVLFTLLVVCSRLSRIFVPPSASLSFRFVFFFTRFRALLSLVPLFVSSTTSSLISFFLFPPSSKNPLFRFCFPESIDSTRPFPSSIERTRKEDRFRASSHVGWPAPRIYKIRHDRATIHSILAKLSIPRHRTRPIVYSRRRGFRISPCDFGTQLLPKPRPGPHILFSK